MKGYEMFETLQKIVSKCERISELNECLPEKLELRSSLCSNLIFYSVYVGDDCLMKFTRRISSKKIGDVRYVIPLNEDTKELISDHLKNGLEKYLVSFEKKKIEEEDRKYATMRAMKEKVFALLGEVK